MIDGVNEEGQPKEASIDKSAVTDKLGEKNKERLWGIIMNQMEAGIGEGKHETYFAKFGGIIDGQDQRVFVLKSPLYDDPPKTFIAISRLGATPFSLKDEFEKDQIRETVIQELIEKRIEMMTNGGQEELASSGGCLGNGELHLKLPGTEEDLWLSPTDSNSSMSSQPKLTERGKLDPGHRLLVATIIRSQQSSRGEEVSPAKSTELEALTEIGKGKSLTQVIIPPSLPQAA